MEKEAQINKVPNEKNVCKKFWQSFLIRTAILPVGAAIGITIFDSVANKGLSFIGEDFVGSVLTANIVHIILTSSGFYTAQNKENTKQANSETKDSAK